MFMWSRQRTTSTFLAFLRISRAQTSKEILSLTCHSSSSSSSSSPSSCSSGLHRSVHQPLFSRLLSTPPSPSPLMELKKVLEVLEQFAPLSLAEPWDNVGLLVEPSRPRPISTILLTNDLTEAVMDEAEALTCDLIVSYHPPLFQPIKRLVQRDWKQRLAVRALEGGIAVFSPHTSWDSVRGGVNDWLVAGLGCGQVSVLSQALASGPCRFKLEFKVRNAEELQPIAEQLKKEDSKTTLTHSVNSCEAEGLVASVLCSDTALPSAVQTLLQHGVASQALAILKTEQPPLPGHGQGRLIVLDQSVTVATAVEKMKSHLGMKHLRLALGSGHTLESTVSRAAGCAGSGASVLKGVRADLYVTGEMSHHEVLDAVASGASVILSDHSNSERGFLAVVKEKLGARLPDSVTVAISKADRDPLEVV
ncbi:NIF3-like protein 1 [Gadus chalcogrammus]|uniref:NIF3-like protein 1 n=1 Tax=Gadus chalcogrammus TaxID=1042646 RepID=UPI0024C4DC84|nr:NIF3-like protein 1 [Gadus chalcogrammus]